MALIQPFQGLRYNPLKISDLASVVSLPYDVLTEKDREDLYRANPYNVVRLIWGKDLPGDGPQESKYLRAARMLQDWQKERILVKDEEKAFYLYAQDFTVAGQGEKSRRGIVARVKLEALESGTILRHESTFAGPKGDRLQLLRATRANLDSVFTVYDGGNGKLKAMMDEKMALSPLLDIRDREDIRHRLWAITRPGDHDLIREEVAERQLFIADGHHRYEASLEYHREMVQKDAGGNRENPGHDYAMMVLIDMQDPGLVILPTHRLVGGMPGWNLEGFLARAGEYFSVEEMKLPSTEEGRQRFIGLGLEREGRLGHSFGLYAGGDSIYFLRLRDEGVTDSLVKTGETGDLQKLDVTILDRLILNRLLGYQGSGKDERIGYTPDMKEALRRVEDGICDLAFFVNPTTLHEVKSISLAGGRMPQKSTYFYPKLLSGLVINPHEA
jgi:uncharacterized protein (DUF1015 family)